MFKQHIIPRTVLSLATLTACLAVSTAHAGLLGGAGSLGGTVGPRGLDIGGQGSVSVQRDTSALPNGNKLRTTADGLKGQASDAKVTAGEVSGQSQVGVNAAAQATRDTALDNAATARSTVGGSTSAAAATTAQAVAGTQAATSSATATNSGAAAAPNNNSKAATAGTAATANGVTSASSSTPRGNAAASGTAGIARAGRSLNASASGDAAVSR
ncbi:MAG TPA: hypothetical protein VNU71_11760 [Burkholderiaceae bacterium]|nr:hypothetical protein [Burkholderiaceae bacterium]